MKSNLLLTAATAVVLSILATISATAQEREISGTVLLPHGDPAGNASVRLFYAHCSTGYGSETLAETTTDEKGRFNLTLPDFERPAILIPMYGKIRMPPAVFLFAEKESYAPVAEEVYDRVNDYTLTLEQSVIISLRMTTTRNQGMQGADVWLSNVHGLNTGVRAIIPESDIINRELFRAKNADNGLWEIAVPIGMQGRFAGMGSDLFGNTSFHAGAHRFFAMNRTYRIALQRDVINISGRVTLEDETTPATGMVVTYALPPSRTGYISYCVGNHSYAVTDENGHFEISFALPPNVEGLINETGAFLIARDPSHDPEYADTPVRLPDNLQEIDDIHISMKRGAQVTGNIIDKDSGEALSRAVFSVSPDDELKDIIKLNRLANNEGKFRMRILGNSVIWSVKHPQHGYTLREQHEPLFQRIQGPTEVELSARAAAEAPIILKATYPEGHPVAGETILVFRENHTTHSDAVRTDEQGLARIRGIPVGEAVMFQTIVRNHYGAIKTVQEAATDNDPIELTVRRFRMGEIQLVDDDGEPVPEGIVRLFAMAEDQRPITPVMTINVEDGKARVRGILPNVLYGMRVTARDLQLAGDNGDIIRWKFDDQVAEPTLVVHLEERRRQPPPRPRPDPAPRPTPRTRRPIPYEQTFRDDLRALEETARSFDDTFNENLIWLADNEGRFIARVDPDRNEIRRFDRLFGFERLHVIDIAFTIDRVWVGTDRGLMTWNRRGQSWGRFAVGGIHIETYVREISIRDGIMDVTIGRDDEEPRRFVFDIEEGRWEEL